MKPWQVFSILAPLAFVVYQALTKLLPKGTSIFLVNAYASLVGLIIMLVMHFYLTSNKSMSIGPRTALITLGIGTFIALGNLAILKAFASGAPQSGFTVLYNPAYVIFGLLLGFLVWHEKLNAPQMAGVALALIGVVIIGYFKTA